MTVPAALTTYRYEGNGVSTVFAYSNRLLTSADVRVQILTRATDAVVETLELTTDYTVTIVSNSLANITITNAAKIPSVTQDILLSLNIAISQTRSFPRADSLPAADIELGLDKLTLVAQLIDDAQERSLRFPESDTVTSGELPAKADRLGKFLAFGSTNGEPIVTAVAVGSTPVTAYGATLVQAADAAAARTTLALPFTPASASTPAYLDFAEQTTNGTNRIRLIAPASIASDTTVTLGASGLVLLSAVTASGAASVAFSSTYITSTYDKYVVEFDGVYGSSGSVVRLHVSTNNGSTYEASAYYTTASFQAFNSTTITGVVQTNTTNFALTSTDTISTSAGNPGHGTIKFSNPSSSTAAKMFYYDWMSAATGALVRGAGAWASNTAINNIKIEPASGTITGNFRLYGLQKS